VRRGSALVVVVVVLAGCGGDDDEGDEEASPAATTVEATAGGCRQVAEPSPEPEGTEQPPSEPLGADKTYRVLVRTNCGDFTITLDPKAAPNTTASFVELARNDFYDDTFFHRIVPGFVIQGGDPTATGGGGPGYSTVDTPSKNARYTEGVVAMAKTGEEPPGTAGSQFFVVTAKDTGLPPEYAVIGKVTAGKDVVTRIGELGDPGTELPTQLVVVEDMVVEVE
jgi:peptidyl-prolyl cis-trans isomerase B (cyclophilin B)